MKPTETLKTEHRVIETVLDCLEKLVDEIEATGVLDDGAARQMLDFFSAFADRCHHGKEEELLFAALERRGFSPTAGPTAVMRSEHTVGRELIGAMRRSLDGSTAERNELNRRFAGAALQYLAMLREHIQKEDHCLFAMADQMLTEAEQRELETDFASFELGDQMTGEHERCLAIANSLARRFDVDGSKSIAKAVGTCGHHTVGAAV